MSGECPEKDNAKTPSTQTSDPPLPMVVPFEAPFEAQGKQDRNSSRN
jgi:hypothetical protein